MALSPNHPYSATLLLMFLFAFLHFTGAQIGVSYGRDGEGLPSPSQVVALFNQYNIRRMRIYDAFPDVFQALRGSAIDLTVGILNRKLQEIADSQANAGAWVNDNIRNYPDVRFKHIVVGNEVSPRKPDTSQYVPFVLPAMRNIRAALDAAGLRDIRVTTAIETELLDPDNFPPSKGRFREEVKGYIDPIVAFLVETGAPIFANIYPYFAYVNNRQQISFNYAFLQPNSGIIADGVYYDNLYYALVDTLNAALEKSTAQISLAQNGEPKVPPEVIGGENGVPTAEDQIGVASIENARIYNNNLVRVVKNGTPRRPHRPIETYIFSMFDENLKPGPAIEQNFGLFYPNGQPKYVVDFSLTGFPTFDHCNM